MSARSIRRARERAIRREQRRRTRLGSKALVATAATGATVLFAPAAANAATFEVNDLGDPGDGTCDGDECTLREAVEAANGTAGADTVTFASGLSGAIYLEEGQIEITEGLTIAGPGADVITVDANYDSRIFYVSTADTDVVSISGLALTHGSVGSKYEPETTKGGAIYLTDGSGDLNVSDSVLTENNAFAAKYFDIGAPLGFIATYGSGGAIAADGAAGDLTITGSTLRGNFAGKYGGAVYAADNDTIITGSTIVSNEIVTFNPKYQDLFSGHSGGGVFADGATLAIEASRLSGNYAGNGGGVYVGDTDEAAATGVSLTGTELSNNIAGKYGGGIHLESPDSATQIQSSIITDNTSIDDGGGIALLYAQEFGAAGGAAYGRQADDAPVTVTDTTISDNTSGGDGAGAHVEDANGPVTIQRSTLADNFASGDGGGLNLDGSDVEAAVTIDASTISGNESRRGGGLYLSASHPVTVQNSTVSGNTAAQQGGGVFIGYLDADGEETTGTLDIKDTTIAGNAAHGHNRDPDATGVGGGVYLYDGTDDDADRADGDVNISSTVIADSTEGADIAQTGDDGEDDTGALNVGHSLIESPDATAFASTPAGSNITGVDPQLGPLTNNGGPTETMLPSFTSPLIDAGLANGLVTDQRGEPRTVNQPAVPNAPGSDGTDIGSVELPEVPAGNCAGQETVLKVGDAGDNILLGTGTTDLIFGGAGDDKIGGLGKDDCLFGEAGRDKVDGNNGSDRVDGGGGRDRVKGGGGKDRLFGRGGHDILAAGGGKDKLKGGRGDDQLRGAEGADKLKGNSGDDRLKGAGGEDTLVGGPGQDRLNCGPDEDVAIAGPGDKVSNNCETVK